MILPPGPQLALSSSLLITLTSQFHCAASGRNLGAWAIRRLAITCTRLASALDLSSTPLLDASPKVCWYDWAYIWLTSSVESMLNIYCLRSTPTAPPLVVFTAWQPASRMPALNRLTTKDLRMRTLPIYMRRILG